MVMTMDRADGMRETMRDEWIDRWASAIHKPSHSYTIKDWVWERILEQRDLTVRRFRRRRAPDPSDKLRADAFFPRWTGLWEVV